MPVTRDENFPAEMANLMQAFNRCADGHEANAVLNASLQMLSASIGFVCKKKGLTLRDAEGFTDDVCQLLRLSVTDNWSREASPRDVEVKLG